MPAAPRFYCPNLPHPRLSERMVPLDEDQTRHARKVLRLQAGDPVLLFDGNGTHASAVLDSYVEGLAVCRIGERHHVDPPKPVIVVATAIPKGGRADDMVNHLSQLGCDRLIPLKTARSVVEPRDAKLDRFAKAAIEAGKQSGRPYLLEVDSAMMGFEAVLLEQADVKLIAAIGEHRVEELLASLRAAQRVLVLIGPEGDWTDEEVAAAKAAGFMPWTLGPNVLRVEAAAAAACAVLRYLAQS